MAKGNRTKSNAKYVQDVTEMLICAEQIEGLAECLRDRVEPSDIPQMTCVSLILELSERLKGMLSAI